jgi:acetyltransferase-like isoleucine patch superfamily enzyme
MRRRERLERFWRDRFETDHDGMARPVRIGDNVWIGFDAVILPGVTIGQGSIVGARSVVAEDVPPFTVAAGNPARVIKQLEPCEVPGAV